MGVISASLGYLIFFIVVELIVNKTGLNKELSRKIVHILAGISAAALPFVLTFHQIITLALLFIPVMLYSKKANLFKSIHHVKRKTLGEVYFPFAILITAFLFPDRVLYGFGILVMAISDGSASLIGQKYGSHKHKLLKSQKSLEGSISFAVSALAICLVLLLLNQIAFWAAILVSLILALVLTVVEASLGAGLDNLVLAPLGSGCLLLVLNILGL